MIIRLEHFIILLMITVIILAGCDESNQELPSKDESPREKPAETLNDVADVPIIEIDPNQVEKLDPFVKRVPFPETYKSEDAHIWQSIFVDAVNDPDYIQQLIPDEPQDVLKSYINITIVWTFLVLL